MQSNPGLSLDGRAGVTSGFKAFSKALMVGSMRLFLIDMRQGEKFIDVELLEDLKLEDLQICTSYGM